MRFGFEQRWDAAVDEVLEVYLDPDFWASLGDLRATSAPTVLEVAREGDRATVRLQYALAVQLPREAARFIDTSEVAWVEETRWNLSERSAEVRFLPTQASSLLRASADARIEREGDDAVRRVRGDLRVRIPLLGSRVERAVVDGVGEHLEAEAEAVAARLG